MPEASFSILGSRHCIDEVWSALLNIVYLCAFLHLVENVDNEVDSNESKVTRETHKLRNLRLQNLYIMYNKN